MLNRLTLLYVGIILLGTCSCADHFSVRKEIRTSCKLGTEPTQKVLFIGIDGVRTDALQFANTPAIDSLMQESYVSYHSDRGPYTVSVPGWSSILHGVWPEKHGLTENSFKQNHYQHYPDLFTLAKEMKKDISVATLSNWDDFLKITAKEDFSQRYTSDLLLFQGCKEKLLSCCPDIMVLHFDDPDHAGHTDGFSPDVPSYISAIEQTDAYVKELMDIIRQRENLYQEKWMVVLTTDHGGEGTGHGGQDDLPQTRYVWSIVRTPDVHQTIWQTDTKHVDLLPTMLKWMGISPENFPDLDGQSFF